MAQRLMTNYANAFLTLTEDELYQFIGLFVNDNLLITMQEQDNGDRILIISDHQEKIELAFHRVGSRYACESSYSIKDLRFANTMRKAFKQFRGHGVVHRVYENFTMIYHYDEGAVIRIEESADDHGAESLVFESNQNHQQVKQLETLFQQNGVESEIDCIREETDRLLDLRNWTKRQEPEKTASIDRKLAELSRRLYALEV